MRVEHKLSPAVAAAIKRLNDQLNANMNALRMALGDAKQAEMNIGMLRTMMGDHLAVVQESEKLPASTVPYTLSPDGLSLIGEAADPASADETATAAASPLVPACVNGKTNHAAQDR